jgi:hypothetical protein
MDSYSFSTPLLAQSHQLSHNGVLLGSQNIQSVCWARRITRTSGRGRGTLGCHCQQGLDDPLHAPYILSRTFVGSGKAKAAPQMPLLLEIPDDRGSIKGMAATLPYGSGVKLLEATVLGKLSDFH